MEGPTKVDLDHALPCVFVYAIEALAFRLPGVVDQDIDDAERLFGLRKGLHDLTALGDVAAHEDRLPRKTAHRQRSEEHTSELQSLMRISYAVFCLKKKKTNT